MSAIRHQPQTKRDLIIEVWETLDCESVGARELLKVQRVVREKFGAGAVDSPAAIARTLADEGAVLRHPEVIECDARWREQHSGALLFQDALNFDGLAKSAESMKQVERLRVELARDSDDARLQLLIEAVRLCRKDCLLLAGSEVVEKRKGAEAGEIAEWLSVWLKQPEIFADWLELRRRSAEFRRRFDELVD